MEEKKKRGRPKGSFGKKNLQEKVEKSKEEALQEIRNEDIQPSESEVEESELAKE